MSAVIALCHFCDQHGPSVLINTRVQEGSLITSNRSPTITTNHLSTCNACKMVDQYVSIDEVTQVQYISCQLPSHLPQLTAWLQHVCVRSLSCEVNPCLFSEQENCVMSVAFSVRDAMSRGFYRWFSIVVTMRDLSLLAASWQFLYRIINSIITKIQDKTQQVYTLERPHRLNSAPCYRSLSELTRSNRIFAWLHSWFSWLLRCESRYFHERISRSPYFYAKPDLTIEQGDIRSLRSLLTPEVFTKVALGLVEGKQIIIRGDMAELVTEMIATLQMLLPKHCSKAVTNSDEYMEPSVCNLLGVGTHVAVPRPTNGILRVDMINGGCVLKTLDTFPTKYPTMLNKLLKALDNETLNTKSLAYYLIALKQEWLNIAVLLDKTKSENICPLLVTLGLRDRDKHLLRFWCAAA